MFDKKRLIVSIIMGSILGIICIVGAQLRSGFSKDTVYLMAFWYNRFLLGLFIGFLGSTSLRNALIRGFIFGAIVSFAFYSATGFSDVIGFIAGMLYGGIIEGAAYLLLQKNKNKRLFNK